METCKIKMKKPCRCKLCGSSESFHYLYDFGKVPVAGYLETDQRLALEAPRYELSIGICLNDGLVQQAYDNAQDELNRKVYSQYQQTYSMSDRVTEYMNSFLNRAIAASGATAGDKALEIGSNDGQVLKMLKARALEATGFEPSSNLVRIAKGEGLEVVDDFFGTQSAGEYLQKFAPVKLLLTRHTLEHAYEPHDFLCAIESVLEPDGLAVIEVPYLKLQMMNNHFEAMTFQHISFFTLTSIQHALESSGLVVVDVSFVNMDGGSMVIYAKKKSAVRMRVNPALDHGLQLERLLGLDLPNGYKPFFQMVDKCRKDVKEYLRYVSEKGIKLVGYGAGSKGQSLLNMIGISSQELPIVIDDTPANNKHYIPGVGSLVLPSGHPEVKDADMILLTAPTHIHEILHKEVGRYPETTQFFATVPEFHQVAISKLI